MNGAVSMSLFAQSIARPIHHLLQRRSFGARVLAAFPHVCDLATAAGDVLALVTPEIGNGPLNIVLGAPPAAGEAASALLLEALAGLKPGMPAGVEGTALRIGDLSVALQGAVVWEPRPAWETLRARWRTMSRSVSRLQALCLAYAPAESLLCMLQADAAGAAESVRAVQAAVKASGSLLRSGWAGEEARLREGAAWLAGLGGGLTPAGDDFLCGIMLAAWLAHPEPAAFCQVVIETAAPRTTLLSTAFLRAAGRGECGASWHRLLAALSANREEEIASAAHAILQEGATSGADALTGFVTGCLCALRA